MGRGFTLVKTYLSTGIGDMMSLDALLTKEEKEDITELFWGCRWGKALLPLFFNNPAYPNLKQHSVIDDETGKSAMKQLDPVCVNFWHFRPDFHTNYEVGLSLFNLTSEDVTPIDAVAILKDPSRKYQGSSFLENAEKDYVDWDSLNTTPDNYILVHYPTSTRRGRNDIGQIEAEDWNFIETLSKNKNLYVLVISDTEITPPLSKVKVLVNYDIKAVAVLCKYAEYYVGCDSWVSLLSCKALSPEKLYVKGHDYQVTHGRYISEEIRNSVWLQQHYCPHKTEDIVDFYRSKLELREEDKI